MLKLNLLQNKLKIMHPSTRKLDKFLYSNKVHASAFEKGLNGDIRDFRGQTLDWLPTDTEKLYLTNIKKFPEFFADKEWTQPGNITYHINAHGFRGEFYTEPDIVALGCSNTMGIGLPEDKIWCYQLGQKLNMTVTNLGVGGIGTDSIYNIVKSMILSKIVKPKFVAMLVPPIGRLEIRTNHHDVQQVNTASDSATLIGKHWWLNDENSTLFDERNIMAIYFLLESLNIPIIHLNSNQLLHRRHPKGDLARDMMHPGPVSHNGLSQLMANLIQTFL